MINLKTQNPNINEDGVVNYKLEKHYAEDENGVRYYIKQVETGIEYAEAIDVVPCRYTYEVTNRPIEK